MRTAARIKKQQPMAEVAEEVERGAGREGIKGWMVWAMIGLSGFACLVYQILWMRQLGLLYGNSSQAAALTLAVFFAGLAAGGWWWGARSRKMERPLQAYAWLEWGIAGCGFAVMVAPMVVGKFYPMIYQRHGSGIGLIAFKLLWTWLMVFPAALLMGGTLPLVGQAVIRGRAELGRTGALMYAVNTLGAACGAFAAAFVFISTLGVRLTCGVAMAASVLAGLMAFGLSKRASSAQTIATGEARHEKVPLPRWVIRALAFFSGFQLLALEVIWTRMLAQVHENSVYAFSSILIVVLICLALGAALAGLFVRAKWPTTQTLVILFVLGGGLLCAMPQIFLWITGDLQMLATDVSLEVYAWRLFVMGFVLIGPACLLLGAVFPLLMKSEECYPGDSGMSIGILSAINTVGAIVGSLVAGFVLLEYLGLWRSLQWIAVGYLLVALIIPTDKNYANHLCKILSGVMVVLIFTVLNPKPLSSVVTYDDYGKRETILDTWEASDCTVTVVKDSRDDVAIKINSSYSLGSTAQFALQMYQARIPLLAFPDTDRVFFLGMGTGITAGEALDSNSFPQVAEVVACELSPSVVAASKKYFSGSSGNADLTNGLFSDPRAKVLTEDGRNHLMATDKQYSMINADLFLPYRRGTGNLYSREHYDYAKQRQKAGGVFVQWLPLYQLSELEFGIIARTMLSVFPQVSLWRGNFQPGAEIAALVGHADLTPLPACEHDAEPEKRAAVAGVGHLDMHNLQLPTNEQTVLFFYAGNLSKAHGYFEKYPVNTDDRPVIEYGTPRSLHRPSAEGKPQFLESRFAELVSDLLLRTPPETDPLLQKRNIASRNLAHAGLAFHRAAIASVHDDENAWRSHWQNFLQHWIANPVTPSEK